MFHWESPMTDTTSRLDEIEKRINGSARERWGKDTGECLDEIEYLIDRCRQLEHENEQLSYRNGKLERVAEAAKVVLDNYPGWPDGTVMGMADLETSLRGLDAGEEK